MKHFPIGALPHLHAGDSAVRALSVDDVNEELLAQSKAYLECRSCGVEAPPDLAEAWGRLYDLYAPRIRAFLRKYRLPAGELNDCSQDVWKEVVVKLAHFDPDPGRARLSTWIMTLAHNKAVDSIRRRNRHILQPLGDHEAAVPEDPRPGPAAEYERGRTLARVRGVLAELASQVSPTSFQVLYLRWIEDQPTAAVAAALDLTPEQVRFRAHRMKRKFRELLDRSVGQDGLDANP